MAWPPNQKLQLTALRAVAEFSIGRVDIIEENIMVHQVIVVCSSEDKTLYKDLDRALSAAKREGLLVLRSTADFVDDVALVSAIDAADIVVVLLTPALVDSSLWTGVVLQQTKATVDCRSIPVVPIVVQRCDWQRSWLGRFAGLPRDSTPLSERREGTSAGWLAVAAELRRLLTARTPRTRDVPPAHAHDAGTLAALVPGDLSEVRHAYRRVEQYHEALLRVVDAAERATEGILGPLQQRSWSPGALYHPGSPAGPSPGASLIHIPLKHVSYTWASTHWLQAGGCRVILVHDGDGAFGPPCEGGREPHLASRSSLSAFAACVVRQHEQRSHIPDEWESADRRIARAPGFSRLHWEDGEVHVAETHDMSFRFGGFSQGMAHILASASPKSWLTRLRTLISGVKEG